MSDEAVDFLSAAQVAEIFGVHENTVRAWEKRGLLTAARLPRSGYRRFSPEEVERMRHDVFGQFAPAVTDDDLPGKFDPPTEEPLP